MYLIDKRWCRHFSSWSFLLLLCMQLVGCSAHHYSKDGPPPFDVDVSKIPDAVPKPEPKSKFGNPPSYVALGKRYYVLKSSHNFEEKGTASWYGMKFHKQRTSSGEPYDLTAMTAAHRTLPLPTYALVTNLKNGKHVVVKINDRGPFADNRVMDLSYAAAKKLGITGHGTGYVDIKAIDPYHPELVLDSVKTNTTPISTPPVTQNTTTILASAANQQHKYLQMGAFSSQENAQKLANRLSEYSSYPAHIKAGELNGQTIYRVQIGPMPSVASSTQLVAKLENAGLGKPMMASE